MDRRPRRRPQSPPVPPGGPACGRRPSGCLPSPWSSANAAIFQPARVTSGAAGAGAGVGAGWGQGCPALAEPHVLAGQAGGPHWGGGIRRPRAVAESPAQRGFPRRRGWQHLAVLWSLRSGPCSPAGAVGSRHCSAPTPDKLRMKKPGKRLFACCL